MGETETVSGTVYTVVDDSTIRGEIAKGNINLCTTFVTDMTKLFRFNSSFNGNISF